ncbi:MAG: acyl-CoA thioesterase, partial [Rhodospirillales bacterium]
CDGARIAFYPNFVRWMDAAAWHFFAGHGLSAKELLARHGCTGFPLVDAGATFRNPARFGDRIEIETALARWGAKSFELKHTLRIAGLVAAEGRETRIWAVGDPADPQALRAGAIPAEVKALIPAANAANRGG